MAITLTIAVGSVLLVVCGFAWVARREEVTEVAELLSLSPVTIDEAETGTLCAIVAKVAGPPGVQDPVLDQNVVFFEARVLRRDRGEVLCTRGGGKTVRLEDGSGCSATVDLVGAELGMPEKEVEHSDRELSPRMSALLSLGEETPPEPHGAARYTLEHRAIVVGDQLTLVGVPTSTEDGTLRFTSKHRLFLTPEPLETLQARQKGDLLAMDRMLRIGLVLGVGCLLAALVLAGVYA